MQVLINGELYEKVLIAGPSGASGPTTPANSISVVPATGQGSASVIAGSDYPEGATPTIATSGVVAGSSAAVATLAGVSGKVTHLSWVDISGTGATGAASTVTATITGLLGGTISRIIVIPMGATSENGGWRADFYPPLPASAAGTSIVVTCPIIGVGGSHVANAGGYQL